MLGSWFPFRTRKTDPQTSKEAAARVEEFAPSQHQTIIALLKEYGKQTPEQIAAHMGIDAYAVRKRLPELQRQGLALPTGETAKTASGRSQRVWIAICT